MYLQIVCVLKRGLADELAKEPQARQALLGAGCGVAARCAGARAGGGGVVGGGEREEVQVLLDEFERGWRGHVELERAEHPGLHHLDVALRVGVVRRPGEVPKQRRANLLELSGNAHGRATDELQLFTRDLRLGGENRGPHKRGVREV